MRVAFSVGLLIAFCLQSGAYFFLDSKYEALLVSVAKKDAERVAEIAAAEAALTVKETAHEKTIKEAIVAYRASIANIRNNDVAVADRLRSDAERRAAKYRAQAIANEASCRDLADQHTAFDEHIVRGTEVVAGLTTALAVRDAEVAVLFKQISADRELFEESSK